YYLHKKGAGGSRWNQFAKYWSQAGHRITVLAGMLEIVGAKKFPEYRGKFLVTEYDGSDIVVKRCHVSESYNKSTLGRAWGYISFAFSSTLAGLFVKKPDVIICTSPALIVGLTGAILSWFKRVPMVFEVRDLWPESVIDLGAVTNKWAIKAMYWLQSISYGKAKWINVLTPAFEEFLINVNGVPADKISMIPNGADLDIIKPDYKDNWVREKHNLTGKFVVTYVGAHGATNTLSQLINAAVILKDKAPDVQFLLVGDGIRKAQLIEQASENSLDNVTFVPPVPKTQIGDYVNASDVCTAVLKRIESFKTVYPNKVFDYMAAAKPIIIGIDGVARKLIEDAGSGIYVEPENPQEFAEAVLKLKDNPELCREYGRSGLSFVRENFDRKMLADKYLNILINKVVTE
ncbi:MAG: glycosyltransferase family 4 protein, partial [Planctomycetota bacterium]